MNKIYKVQMEISGSTAMWTRPDTGDAPVSYPAPTAAAVKGIFESVLRLESVEVCPEKVEICSPLAYHTYTTNYGGPLRKSKSIQGNNSYQLLATVLINVCYRLYATVQEETRQQDKRSARAMEELEKNGRVSELMLNHCLVHIETNNGFVHLIRFRETNGSSL